MPWRSLVKGLLALGALVTLGAWVLMKAEIGGVRGTTIPLHVAFREARDIMPNTEVWWHGERVGTVRTIRFNEPQEGQLNRVLITMDVVERARPYIRRDAMVQVRRGESFLGAPVLYIAGGSPGFPSVNAGDTLGTTRWLDQDQLAVNIRGGVADVRAVMSNIRVTARAIREAQGSIAAMMGTDDSSELSEIQVVLASWSSLNERTQALRSVTADTAMRAGIVRLMARLDSLEEASRHGTARLALSDTTLRTSVAGLAEQLSVVRQHVRERISHTRAAVGADSGMAPDLQSSTAAELSRFDAALSALIEDLKKRPWRYVGF